MAEENNSLELTAIYRAASRPNLLLGAERNLVLATGTVAAVLIFAVLTMASVIFGIILWIIAVGFLRMMAKSDAQMSVIYRRHINYLAFYRPTPSAWRKS